MMPGACNSDARRVYKVKKDREKKNIFANLLLEYFICNPFNKGSGDLIS
jgi:hypothetical protein